MVRCVSVTHSMTKKHLCVLFHIYNEICVVHIYECLERTYARASVS